MEIFGIELEEATRKMSESFGDRITLKSNSRGYLIDGILLLLQYCTYDNLYYMECARVGKSFNNSLRVATRLRKQLDDSIKEYGSIGLGMYKNSPFKPILYLFERRYNVIEKFSSGSILVWIIKNKEEIKWDSVMTQQKQDKKPEIVKTRL